MSRWCELRNAQAVPLAEVPDLSIDALRNGVLTAVAAGARLGCWCGDGAGRVIAILVDDAGGRLLAARAVVGDSYPALTPDCPQAHLFERELAEQYGVVPLGHPWLKPLRFHHRADGGPDAWGREAGSPIEPGVCDMFRVEGDEIHEVAVGPVHAGVIEPGHFRFQCHGEHVFHLEINLGYQHRGIERAAVGGPHPRTLYQMEAAAGDTTIGHAWAHCLVVEALAGTAPAPGAQGLRALMLEFERLANHTGDLGAMAGDVGFLPTASFNGRIRGDFLNLSAAVCGSRLGRGMLVPGGVRFALDRPRCDACGTPFDARRNHPVGAYRGLSLLPAVATEGDVNARAQVRWLELRESMRLAEWLLSSHVPEPPRVAIPPPRPDHLAVGMVEGWRGPVLHLGLTGADGRLSRYKVVDPSFHNWFGLALALRDEQISDFPLCNKSFNLSYCGVDL